MISCGKARAATKLSTRSQVSLVTIGVVVVSTWLPACALGGSVDETKPMSFGGSRATGTGGAAGDSSSVGATSSGGNVAISIDLGIAGTSAAPAPTLIAAGLWNTCALLDGGLRCWGSNDAHQIRSYPDTDVLVPVQVPGLAANVTNVAIGNGHVCAITDGILQCWGSGGLGDAAAIESAVPITVKLLSGRTTSIAAASRTTCAIVNGGAWCWGAVDFAGDGWLGNGTSKSSNVPTQVLGLTSNVTAIATTGTHSCAIAGGKVWCWGDNSLGELGNGNTTPSTVPVQVQDLDADATALALGGGFSCALANDGVMCWGLGGPLGESLVPILVRGLGSSVTAIAANGDAICALANGAVWCRGPGPVVSTSPTQVLGLESGVTTIAAGSEHFCAIASGKALCWGANWHGQLGDGTTSESKVPVPVKALP